LRIVANQLFQESQLSQSLWLLSYVAKLRAEEPQSHRELAILYAECKDYQKAIDILWLLIVTEWETRFQHIEDEVLMEMNR
jgi:Ca-activated chloride channel family protein